MPNGDIIAAGLFSTAGSANANCVARWDGVAWSALGAGTGFVIAGAVLPNGHLVVGGQFNTAGGIPARQIVRWDGAAWSALGAGFNDHALAVAALPNGDIAAGGWFLTAGASSASFVALRSAATGSWLPLGSGLNGGVAAMTTLPNGDLVVGGWFSQAGGLTANHIARWTSNAWSPMGGTNAPVQALLALPGGNIIAGGEFTVAGGISANRVARWNGSGWQPLGAGLNGRVTALLALPNGDIIAGGDFTQSGSTATNYIARWDGGTWSPLGNGMNGAVRSLAVLPTGMVIAGGEFTVAGGTNADRIASWDGAVWLPLGAGLNYHVHTLAVLANGDLVVGGRFTSAGGTEASRLAKWDGTAWTRIGTGADETVTSLALLPNGDLVAGGWFSLVGGVVSASVAVYKPCVWSRSIRLQAPAVLGQVAAFAIDHPVSVAGNPYFVLWCAPSYPSSSVVTLPGLTVDGLLRVNPASFLMAASGLLSSGNRTHAFTLPIPNSSQLLGFTFDVQAADLSLGTAVLTFTEDEQSIQIAAQSSPILNMVPIAPGTFSMGSFAAPVEMPVHTVTISRPFWMGKYEVTQALYQSIAGSNPSQHIGPNFPVEQVTWTQAVNFCQALTAQENAAGRLPTGYEYRLPTEAEWEFCCRAGTTTQWYTGTSLSCAQGNIANCVGVTTAVGSYPPNAWGLHDMHGNVWEWVLDQWDSSANYPSGAVVDPVGFAPGPDWHPFRGGARESDAMGCRSSRRNGGSPSYNYFGLGFRVVLAPVLPQ